VIRSYEVVVQHVWLPVFTTCGYTHVTPTALMKAVVREGMRSKKVCNERACGVVRA
jgi:hypothetical protein